MQGIYIEQLGLDFVRKCLTLYWGDICYFGFFVAGVILLIYQKNKSLKMIANYTLFLFVTIYNPFLVSFLGRLLNMDDVYYRFFWILPVSFVMAYVCVYLIQLSNSLKKKSFCIIMLIVIIMFTGVPTKYLRTIVKMPDNLYKVSDEVLEVSTLIHNDTTSDNIHLVVASDLLMTIRQYDPSFLLNLNRDFVLCWQGAANFQNLQENPLYLRDKAIMDVIYGGDTSNHNDFIEAIQNTYTDYIVYSKSVEIYEFLENHSFYYLGETDSYYIFRCYTN